MAGLPEGFTIDAPVAPTGSGLPAGFTIDQPAQSGGYDDNDFKKSIASGLVEGATGIAGLPVALANAIRKAKAGYQGQPYSGDITTGSTQNLNDTFEKYVAPLHTPTSDLGSAAKTAAGVVPAMVGGPEGLAAKLLTRVVAPSAASNAAATVTAGTPYQDLASLGAGLAVGGAGMKLARDRAIDAAENPLVTSREMRTSGAHPDQVDQVAVLEKLQKDAVASSEPTNVAIRNGASDLLADPEQADKFSDATKETLQGIADDKPGLGASIYNSGAGDGKSWGVPTIAGLAVHSLADPVVAAKGAAVIARKLADRSALTSIERLKSQIAQEAPPAAAPAVPGVGPTGPKIAPAPQPWGSEPAQPTPPAMPDPQQLKLQMAKLINEREVLAKAQAAQPAPAGPAMPDPQQLKLQMDQLVNQRQALAANATNTQALLKKLAGQNQPTPAPDQTAAQVQDAMQLMAARRANAKLQQPVAPTPPPAPEINPLALPSSITTPAKNIMGGAANALSMRAAADPLAKYEAAVAANAAKDRQNTSALKQDATGLMASRKAAQAAEDANAEPEPVDQTSAQVKEATQLMAARRANAKIAAAVAREAKARAPVASADMAAIAQRLKEIAPAVPSAPLATPEPSPLAARMVAPPVIAKLSKKSGGKLKQTPAPAPEPPPAAPVAPEAPPELPQSDYSHLPRAAAAKLITDRVFKAGKPISVTPEEYQAGVMEKLTAKEKIADDMAKAMPEVEHQDINAHLQGAKTKAGAAAVMEHYIKLHPEAEAAIRLAMAKKRLNAGWTR